MESEQSQNFNDRLSQWVSQQGFWFQIRYSMSASGTKGTAMFHLLTLSLKLLVFLAVVAAGSWLYLAKRTATAGFGDTLKADVQAALSASQVQLSGIKREQGELSINALAAAGGDQSFFSTLEAKNVRGRMGFLDGIWGEWDLGTIGISRLDIDLRAGADDAESAAGLADALFRSSSKVLVNSFEIADASVQWGYRKSISSTGDLKVAGGQSESLKLSAPHTRGAIRNSQLKIQRREGSMRLTFKGGTFSQGWLDSLEIVNLVVNCDREGLTFETALLKHGQGVVEFSGLKVVGGARPLIDGQVRVRNLGLASILPWALQSYLEGTISGDFKVSGSTNEAQGVIFEGDVTLAGEDVISMRDRLPLLKALSVADYSRKYRRVDFREGSFHLRSSGGGVEFSKVDLKADDQFTLEGRLAVRLPSAEEAKLALASTRAGGGIALFNGDDIEDEEHAAKTDDSDFSLRRAALSANRDKELRAGKEGASATSGPSLFERLDDAYEAQRADERSTTQLVKAMRYQGQFRITLLPDAFERAPKLAAQFQVDPQLRRIPMMVPIEGTLYEMTLKMAESIYQDAR
jgi:hypothetical protein